MTAARAVGSVKVVVMLLLSSARSRRRGTLDVVAGRYECHPQSWPESLAQASLADTWSDKPVDVAYSVARLAQHVAEDPLARRGTPGPCPPSASFRGGGHSPLCPGGLRAGLVAVGSQDRHASASRSRDGRARPRPAGPARTGASSRRVDVRDVSAH